SGIELGIIRGRYVSSYLTRGLDPVPQPFEFIRTSAYLKSGYARPSVAGSNKICLAGSFVGYREWLGVDDDNPTHRFWAKPYGFGAFYHGYFIGHERVYFWGVFGPPLLPFLSYAIVQDHDPVAVKAMDDRF